MTYVIAQLNLYGKTSSLTWYLVTADYKPFNIDEVVQNQTHLSNTKPFYAKPFSIPKAYQQITKDEISRLENIGILTKVPSSEWAAPTFVIPKKNKTVRLITDFRGLNKCLKRSPYPMPKIPDIFKGMEKFKYATTIDLGVFTSTTCYLKESSQLQTYFNKEWESCFMTCPPLIHSWMILLC